jgi:hypothetical protein
MTKAGDLAVGKGRGEDTLAQQGGRAGDLVGRP